MADLYGGTNGGSIPGIVLVSDLYREKRCRTYTGNSFGVGPIQGIVWCRTYTGNSFGVGRIQGKAVSDVYRETDVPCKREKPFSDRDLDRSVMYTGRTSDFGALCIQEKPLIAVDLVGQLCIQGEASGQGPHDKENQGCHVYREGMTIKSTSW